MNKLGRLKVLEFALIFGIHSVDGNAKWATKQDVHSTSGLCHERDGFGTDFKLIIRTSQSVVVFFFSMSSRPTQQRQ